MAPKARFERAIRAVAEVLAALETPSAIIGGIAVIAWGHARTTSDIDCSIAASPEEVASLFETFEEHGFEPRVDGATAFAKKNLVMLLRHRATGIPVDASLALSSFEQESLMGATTKNFGKLKIPVVSLTSLLILKLIANRPRDLDDAERLLHAGKWDRSRVVAVLQQFDEAMETDRLAGLLELERRS